MDYRVMLSNNTRSHCRNNNGAGNKDGNPFKSAQPLNRTKLTDGDFSRLFSLFYSATVHEVSNRLTALRGRSEVHGREALHDLTISLFSSYTRIGLLANLSTKVRINNDSFSQKFSSEELQRLGFSTHPLGHLALSPENIRMGPIREICRTELGVLAGLLKMLKKQEKEERKAGVLSEGTLGEFKGLLAYGFMLSDFLKSLMENSTDFRVQLMPVKLRRIKDLIDYVSNENCCKCSISDIAGKENRKEGELAREAPELSLQGNKLVLALALQNIFSNAKEALKNARKNPLEVPVECRITRKWAARSVAFEFKDHGCGMGKEVMDSINSGIRVSTKGDAEPGEHGIGFNYCRGLARQIGANLYVKESTPGLGTIVALELEVR